MLAFGKRTKQKNNESLIQQQDVFFAQKHYVYSISC